MYTYRVPRFEFIGETKKNTRLLRLEQQVATLLLTLSKELCKLMFWNNPKEEWTHGLPAVLATMLASVDRKAAVVACVAFLVYETQIAPETGRAVLEAMNNDEAEGHGANRVEIPETFTINPFAIHAHEPDKTVRLVRQES